MPRGLSAATRLQTHCQRSLGVRAVSRSKKTNRSVGCNRKIDVHVSDTKFACRFLGGPNEMAYLLNNRPEVGRDCFDGYPTRSQPYAQPYVVDNGAT